MHEILENFYAKKLSKLMLSDQKLMEFSFNDAKESWKEKITQDNIKEAELIINNFLSYIKDDCSTVLSIEKEFNINIGNKILLNGFIDKVQTDADGVLNVIDYKTSKKIKYAKRDFMQLKTYAYVLCLGDESIEKIRGSYIFLRHNCETVVKEFSRKDVMTMEGVFLNYLKKIESEKLFRPMPSPLCDYCDYTDICHVGKEYLNNKKGIQTFGVQEWA